MSEGPELTGDAALAAEHALGVLGASERAAAERKMAADPAFATDVEAWRERLSPMLAGVAEVTPRPGVWPRIERALPANDNAGRLRFWRGATVGSLGLAAASLAAAVMLANQPPTLITPPAPLLNASLDATSGQPQPLFVAAYDPTRKALIITSLMPAGTDTDHVHELWLIPADGQPRSLGLVEPGKSKAMPMTGDMAPMFAPGAALAISVEGPGGSPDKSKPSGPIAAMGKLSTI